jgi:hypothetical protein
MGEVYLMNASDRRKSIYSSLAYCRLMEQRFRGAGMDRVAAGYQERSESHVKALKRRRKPYSLPVRCVVFYPEGNGWRESEFWASRPEVAGVVSVGMQRMVDDLLCQRERMAA